MRGGGDVCRCGGGGGGVGAVAGLVMIRSIRARWALRALRARNLSFLLILIKGKYLPPEVPGV